MVFDEDAELVKYLKITDRSTPCTTTKLSSICFSSSTMSMSQPKAKAFAVAALLLVALFSH